MQISFSVIQVENVSNVLLDMTAENQSDKRSTRIEGNVDSSQIITGNHNIVNIATNASGNSCKQEHPRAEFIGLKSLLGVYGYKYRTVVPSLLAYEPEELIAYASKIKLNREKKPSADDVLDFARAIMEEADQDRDNLAKQGLLNELKRELLLFDKIYVCPEEFSSVVYRGVPELEEIMERGHFEFSESAASLHSGPLAEATCNTHRKLMGYWPCLHRVKRNEEEFISNIEANREEVERLFHRLKRLGFKKALQEFSDFGQFNCDLQARRDAQYLRENYDIQVVPLVNSDLSFDIANFVSVASKKSAQALPKRSEQNVAHIILNKLPFPSSDVSIERVLDFKEDPETKRLLLGMKRWIRKTLNSNTSIKELDDEIEYLLLEYGHYMKIHEMKITTGTLETLVVTSAEIVENVARLNLSKAAKSLFSVRNRNLALAEAEMKAPGREISYIVRANKEFGS